MNDDKRRKLREKQANALMLKEGQLRMQKRRRYICVCGSVQNEEMRELDVGGDEIWRDR